MQPRIKIRSEIAELAGRVYEAQIKPDLDPRHRGSYVVINVDTGEYKLDENHLAAGRRARLQWPNGRLFTVRIGYPAVGRIGARAQR